MIKQVHNTLTVHDSSRILKLDSFSEFQNVISDGTTPSVIMTSARNTGFEAGLNKKYCSNMISDEYSNTNNDGCSNEPQINTESDDWIIQVQKKLIN